jgi:signal transduction histidine kinase
MQLERVFDRFFRITEGGVSTFPGLGLGLYIASEIVKRQNGKIWVDSIKGKRSVICFSLPASKD